MKVQWRTSIACSSWRLLLATKCRGAWLRKGVGNLTRRLGAKGRCLAKCGLIVRATKGGLRLRGAILLLACTKSTCRGSNVICESSCRQIVGRVRMVITQRHMRWGFERIQQYLQMQSLRQGQLQELLQKQALTGPQRMALTAPQRPALTALQRPAWPQRLAQSPRIPQTLGRTQTLVRNLHQILPAPLQRLGRVRPEGPVEMRQRQSSKLAAVQLLKHLSQTGPLQQKRTSLRTHREGPLMTCHKPF